MSRKDYVLLAAALRNARSGSADQDAGVDVAAMAIARALAGDNSRFDRARFLCAAGVGCDV